MTRLTLQQANQIIEGALAKAREMKLKPLGVVVLDESGHLRAAQREDAASMFRIGPAPCEQTLSIYWPLTGS